MIQTFLFSRENGPLLPIAALDNLTISVPPVYFPFDLPIESACFTLDFALSCLAVKISISLAVGAHLVPMESIFGWPSHGKDFYEFIRTLVKNLFPTLSLSNLWSSHIHITSPSSRWSALLEGALWNTGFSPPSLSKSQTKSFWAASLLS